MSESAYCKHGIIGPCQECYEAELYELRTLLERERVISGGMREDRDGIVKSWRECEKELEKVRALASDEELRQLTLESAESVLQWKERAQKAEARSDRMAAGLRELYRTLPAGEHLGIVTGLMSDWHPWPETETVVVVGTPRFMGIEGAVFEDVWSDADAPAAPKEEK